MVVAVVPVDEGLVVAVVAVVAVVEGSVVAVVAVVADEGAVVGVEGAVVAVGVVVAVAGAVVAVAEPARSVSMAVIELGLGTEAPDGTKATVISWRLASLIPVATAIARPCKEWTP